MLPLGAVFVASLACASSLPLFRHSKGPQLAHGKSSSLRAARHGERATAAWSGYRRLNQDEFDCYEGYLLGCYGTVELWDRGVFAGERDGGSATGDPTTEDEDFVLQILQISERLHLHRFS